MQGVKKDVDQDTKTSKKLSSAALSRLIKEVTVGVAPQANAYNRTYNRHNR